jgi:hypothetical protein
MNEPMALKAVEAALESDLRIYDVNVPGLQHGVLLGTPSMAVVSKLCHSHMTHRNSTCLKSG